MNNTRQRSATAVLLWLLALGPVIATPRDARALAIVEGERLGVSHLPAHIIELNVCPPRCAADTYARSNPSKLYRPIEPDDIVFDGQVSLLWGDASGSEWLIWGKGLGPTITVWDSSMWVEEGPPIAANLPPVSASRYRVSRELRIEPPPSPRSRRRGGAASRRVGVSGALANAEPSDLGDAGVAPPDLLTPAEPNWLAGALERLSQSQYAVGAVTLSLVVLMARLVR